MSTAQKNKLLARSIARSMEAEGFDFAAVEKIVEQKLIQK
jgi:predicted transposase YdaD